MVKQDTGYVFIEVEDNGEGFEEEILRKLRKKEDISEGEKRIGIMNAIQRVNLIYGERGKIEFFNRPGSGAVVRIYIPIEEPVKEE
jgi:sensor histidine kinase YesM